MAINVVQEIESAARKGEQVVLDTIKSWAQAAQEASARLPFGEVRLPFSEQLPLPTPKQVVSSVYDFAEAMLASQRKFAERALEAASPLFPNSGTDSSTHSGTENGADSDKSAA
jgi:hypothetical protein